MRVGLLILVVVLLLPTCALAQADEGPPAGMWAYSLLMNAVGLLFSCGCCTFWLLLLFGALFSALRVSRLFSWIWEYALLRAIEERIAALWARVAGRRRTERALRQRTLNPRDSKARYNLGVLYMEQRRWLPAIEELRASAEINPERADAHYRLGRCHANLRRLEEARQALEGCLAQRSDHAEGQLLLGRVLLDLAAFEDARAVCTAFAERHREDAEGWLLLGQALAALGERDSAAEHYTRAVECSRHASPVNRARYRAAGRAARAALRRLG